MTESPPPIEYARVGPETPAARPRYLLAIASCFGIAWLVWLGIGYECYDPFDDDLLQWLLAVTVIFGTPCGAILSLIVAGLMNLDSQRRGGES